jgi:hypothetical protein
LQHGRIPADLPNGDIVFERQNGGGRKWPGGDRPKGVDLVSQQHLDPIDFVAHTAGVIDHKRQFHGVHLEIDVRRR